MSFNALPFAYLQWAESAEPLPSFLRYQVYRRQGGSGTGSIIATISDRAQVSYQDYRVGGAGESWEYNVTVVASDTAGEEIESDLAAWVGVEMVIRNVFIHADGDPTTYVEIPIQSEELSALQEIVERPRWSGGAPTAYIGPGEQQIVTLAAERAWESDKEIWDAIRALQAAQREGRTLVWRSYRVPRLFGTLVEPNRSDSPATFAIGLTFRESAFYEAVA
jgi:hypothetical protein